MRINATTDWLTGSLAALSATSCFSATRCRSQSRCSRPRSPTQTSPTHQVNTMEKIFDRTTTEGSARYFQNCVRNGDVEGALSCFDPEAIYVTGPGTQITGKENIRAALAQVCALKPDLQAQRSADFITGDISGWVDEWTLKATTPDGTKLDLRGISGDVLKRQKDGNWAYLIDNPYGAAYLA